MADEWYYLHDGQVHGPIETERLKEMAGRGRLLPADIVWREGSTKQVEATKIEGLFRQPSSP